MTIGWIIGIPVHTSLILGPIKHASVFGIILGVTQWFILRNHISQTVWWILANTVAWPLGFALGLGLIGPWGLGFSGFPIGIVAGTIVGIMVWFVLMQPLHRITQWILVTGAGWGIGFGVGEIVAFPILERQYVTPSLFLGLVLVGTIAGAATGKMLAWLLRQSVLETKSQVLIQRKWMIGLYCILFCLLFVVFVIDYRAEKQSQVDDLQFEEFDGATSIKIYRNDTSPRQILTINNPEKIEFAQEFIKGYPDGWQKPRFSAGIGARINIVFFDGNENLGGYLDFVHF